MTQDPPSLGNITAVGSQAGVGLGSQPGLTMASVTWTLRYVTDLFVDGSGKGSVVALAVGFITAQRDFPWLSARGLMSRDGR